MRERDGVFVDSGAWIALALTRDPLHTRARRIWGRGADLHVSPAGNRFFDRGK